MNLKFKLKNKKAFGYGLMLGNLLAQVILLLMVNYNERFRATYSKEVAVITTLAMLLVGFWFIRQGQAEQINLELEQAMEQKQNG